MTLKQRKEITFQQIYTYAKSTGDPKDWEFVIRWCRSKIGGRHPALGFKGDNSWCVDQIPRTILEHYSYVQ